MCVRDALTRRTFRALLHTGKVWRGRPPERYCDSFEWFTVSSPIKASPFFAFLRRKLVFPTQGKVLAYRLRGRFPRTLTKRKRRPGKAAFLPRPFLPLSLWLPSGRPSESYRAVKQGVTNGGQATSILKCAIRGNTLFILPIFGNSTPNFRRKKRQVKKYLFCYRENEKARDKSRAFSPF